MDHAVADWQSYQNDHDEIDELEGDVEVEEEVGSEVMDDFEKSSNGDYEEWPWLKIFKVEETREGVPIASIVAQQIDREEIRANFYFHMEESRRASLSMISLTVGDVSKTTFCITQ